MATRPTFSAPLPSTTATRTERPVGLARIAGRSRPQGGTQPCRSEGASPHPWQFQGIMAVKPPP